MRRVIEIDGKCYEVGYSEFEGYIKVYGERGEHLVDKHGMSVERALRFAVRALIRAGAVDPLGDEG